MVQYRLMSDDEQLQMKKDTWWEIRLTQQRIACVEKKITDYWEATDKIRKAWEGGNLVVMDGHFCRRQQRDSPIRLSSMRMTFDEFKNTVQEFQE